MKTIKDIYWELIEIAKQQLNSKEINWDAFNEYLTIIRMVDTYMSNNVKWDWLKD